MAEMAPRQLTSPPLAASAQPVLPLSSELSAAFMRVPPGAAWEWLNANASEAAELLAGASSSPSPAITFLTALCLPAGAPCDLHIVRSATWLGCAFIVVLHLRRGYYTKRERKGFCAEDAGGAAACAADSWLSAAAAGRICNMVGPPAASAGALACA